MNYNKLFLITLLSTIPLLSAASTAFPNRRALAKLDRTTREITHSIHEKIQDPGYENLRMLDKVTENILTVAEPITITSGAITLISFYVIKNNPTISFLTKCANHMGASGIANVSQKWLNVSNPLAIKGFVLTIVPTIIGVSTLTSVENLRAHYNLPPQAPITEKA